MRVLDKFDKFRIPYLPLIVTPVLFPLYIILPFNKSILLPVPMNVCKIAIQVANSVDPDQTPHSAASDLGLHCLLGPVFPNMYCKYGKLIKSNPPQKSSWIRPCVQGRNFL